MRRLPRARRVGEDRPARDPARRHPGRRRQPAAVPAGRPGQGQGPHLHRPARRRRGGAGDRHGRRRRPRRRGLRDRGGHGEEVRRRAAARAGRGEAARSTRASTCRWTRAWRWRAGCSPSCSTPRTRRPACARSSRAARARPSSPAADRRGSSSGAGSPSGTSTAPTRPPGPGWTGPSRRSRPTRAAAPTPTCWPIRCRRSGASTSTSRTSRPTRPAASSTGWPARCSCTACARGRSPRARTVVEASSGSTAVSEAYFARMLGLPFVAVMPASTSPEKIELIEFHGGRCHLVRRRRRTSTRRPGGSPPSAAATSSTSSPTPSGPPTGAATTTSPSRSSASWRWSGTRCRSGSSSAPGTGGTSATIGRYLRYRRLPTRLAVVDPEGSSFFPGWRDGDPATATGRSSRIEGIGRPRVEPSFVPTIVDRMICVPDAASLAAMRELERTTGRRAGGSTGTNLWGAFQLVAEMVAAGRTRQRRHPAVRRRRAVRPHLLLRRLGGRAGPGPRAAHRRPCAGSPRRGSGGPTRVTGVTGPPGRRRVTSQ